MRLIQAIKREVDMSDHDERLQMTVQQAENVARLKALAERGDGDAACRLGDRYREGLDGLRYSPRQALHWYARSGMAGDAWGQNNLGACYEHGLGCAQSYANAVKWYRRSVAQGNATATMNLGYCYLRGRGAPMDEAEALRLFRLAVEGGENRAAQEVERLEDTFGLRRLQLASEVPHPDAAPDACSAPRKGTQQARPCVLALGVPPGNGLSGRLQPSDTAQNGQLDGPWEQLHAPETGSREAVTTVRPVIVRQASEPGRHFGFVGIVRSSPRAEVAEDERRPHGHRAHDR
jgi:hypothetical protein